MKLVEYINKRAVCLISCLSPKTASKYVFKRAKNKKLNLKEPIWFNEKLMWIKLNNYNKNKIVWKCSDKYYVREYAREKGVLEENLPKIIATYKNANEIDFEQLPSKFALKCTHGCGFNIICLDKDKIDQKEVCKKLNKWLKTKFGYENAEVHYTHIKPRIICEEFIENEKGEFPVDYKIYCFNGIPKIILVCIDRKNGYQTAFFDLNWNRIYLRKNEYNGKVNKPKQLKKMLELSEILSKEFPFVRIDFYEHNNYAILGEMTFTPAACLGEYTIEAELKLGKMLNIK